MKLGERLAEIIASNPETFVYLSSREAFWFIGTAEDALKEAKGISDEYKKVLIYRAQKVKKRLVVLPQYLAECITDLNTERNKLRFWNDIDVSVLNKDKQKERKKEMLKLEEKIQSLKYKRKKLECEMQTLPQRDKRYDKRVAEWTDLLDREIKDEYPRRFVKPYGQIIIIEGGERGAFWDLDEYKAKGKEWKAEVI